MTATCPDCGCPPEKPGRVANPYRPRGPHGMWKDCKHPFHSTPDPVDDSTPVSEGSQRRWAISGVEPPLHMREAGFALKNVLQGPQLEAGERVQVVPESRATDAEADAHNARLECEQHLAARDAAEAERDRLREALERITTESVDITTPILTLRALDDLRAIARSALNTGTDDGRLVAPLNRTRATLSSGEPMLWQNEHGRFWRCANCGSSLREGETHTCSGFQADGPYRRLFILCDGLAERAEAAESYAASLEARFEELAQELERRADHEDEGHFRGWDLADAYREAAQLTRVKKHG